jgi:hypothetical protein
VVCGYWDDGRERMSLVELTSYMLGWLGNDLLVSGGCAYFGPYKLFSED